MRAGGRNLLRLTKEMHWELTLTLKVRLGGAVAWWPCSPAWVNKQGDFQVRKPRNLVILQGVSGRSQGVR